MRKWISFTLAALLLFSCLPAALAENAAPGTIMGSLEEGAYVIRVPLTDETAQWQAEEAAPAEEPIVRLAWARVEGDVFEARYEPVRDGLATVTLRRYEGLPCTLVLTWDLRVENGAVVSVDGGSSMTADSDDDLDHGLTGAWLECESQFTQLEIERNPEGGWNVTLASPVSHAAYLYRAHVFMDCEKNALVYADGAVWNLPLTGDKEPGDPAEQGLGGQLTLEAEGESLRLVWPAEASPEGREIVFERADSL